MAGTSPSALSRREYTILKVLWDQGPLTVREVRELLAGAGAREEIPYTTVLSLLQLMERKGYVVHEADGKTYRYRAKVSRGPTTRRVIRIFSAVSSMALSNHCCSTWRMTPGSILERGRRCGRSWNSGARHPNRRVLAMTDRTRWWVEALGHWGLAWALVVLFVGGWISALPSSAGGGAVCGLAAGDVRGPGILPAIAGVVPRSLVGDARDRFLTGPTGSHRAGRPPRFRSWFENMAGGMEAGPSNRHSAEHRNRLDPRRSCPGNADR